MNLIGFTIQFQGSNSMVIPPKMPTNKLARSAGRRSRGKKLILVGGRRGLSPQARSRDFRWSIEGSGLIDPLYTIGCSAQSFSTVIRGQVGKPNDKSHWSFRSNARTNFARWLERATIGLITRRLRFALRKITNKYVLRQYTCGTYFLNTFIPHRGILRNDHTCSFTAAL